MSDGATLFRKGHEYGDRMLALFDAAEVTSARRAFISGVVYAVYLREKRKGPSRPHPPTPTMKLMLDKHQQLIDALTENANLRDRIAALKKQLAGQGRSDDP